MNSIGGFLGLELPRAGQPLHNGAARLSSGRACLHRILREINPRHVRVPFYVCDAVLQAIGAAGGTLSFYALDESLAPQVDPPAGGGDAVLVVNYFGLMTATVEGWAGMAGAAASVIVDDSQAFFRCGRDDRWSFNSARKFFGVPDGAYLYGPLGGRESYPPSLTGDADHLLARLDEADSSSLDRYRAHEARFTADVRAISVLAERLLAGIDYPAVAAARRANFAVAHELLGDANRMALTVTAGDVPMSYPFWPRQPIEHERLWEAGIFAPRLWPEVTERAGSGYDFERQLARELLALPIDQRYRAADIHEMCRRVRALL